MVNPLRKGEWIAIGVVAFIVAVFAWLLWSGIFFKPSVKDTIHGVRLVIPSEYIAREQPQRAGDFVVLSFQLPDLTPLTNRARKSSQHGESDIGLLSLSRPILSDATVAVETYCKSQQCGAITAGPDGLSIRDAVVPDGTHERLYTGMHKGVAVAYACGGEPGHCRSLGDHSHQLMVYWEVPESSLRHWRRIRDQAEALLDRIVQRNAQPQT